MKKKPSVLSYREMVQRIFMWQTQDYASGHKALLEHAANVLVPPMGPGLKLSHLSKLTSINFGRQPPSSSPNPILTARQNISLMHNGDTMLDMNDDVDVFTENTIGYIEEQTHKEEDFSFLFNWAKLRHDHHKLQEASDILVPQGTKQETGKKDSHTDEHQRVPWQER